MTAFKNLIMIDPKLIALGELIEKFDLHQHVVDTAPGEPQDQEYWNRDDAGVAVAEALLTLLSQGYTLTPPIEGGEKED